jgi:hypothetical protein
MWSIRFTAVLALTLAAAVPLHAQTTTMPTRPSPPGGYVAESRERGEEPARAAVRACMEPKREEIRPQVKAQMQQWRAANPTATEEARHAERKTIARPLLHAAFEQCKTQVRSNMVR